MIRLMIYLFGKDFCVYELSVKPGFFIRLDILSLAQKFEQVDILASSFWLDFDCS
jgi:hypothetical protein